MLERSEDGLWVVADGVGGHTAGDFASQMIVDAMRQVQIDTSLDKCIDNIEDRLLAVNSVLIQKAREEKRQAIIGSTVIVFLVYEKYGVYIWAGDSRLYRLRDGQIRQLTTDHSQVEEYIERGIIDRDEGPQHPHGNIITRAVGVTDDLCLEMEVQEIKKKDRYLLCSDGLTKHVFDLEFQDILQQGAVKTVCTELVDLTLARGAIDNVTAVIIDIK